MQIDDLKEKKNIYRAVDKYKISLLIIFNTIITS